MLLFIAFPKHVFSLSLYDDSSFMEYEDVINIKKDGNLLKCENKIYKTTSYYLLIISDSVQQRINERESNLNKNKIFIHKGTKIDRGYSFYIGFNLGSFELVHIKNKYFKFFDFETIKVILGELLQKSEKELIELCVYHIEKNGKTGKVLPLQYYLALDMLSENHKNSEATEKLKQSCMYFNSDPGFTHEALLQRVQENKGMQGC